MNRKSARGLLDEIASDNLSSDINLLPKILTRVKAGNQQRMLVKRWFQVAIPVVVIMLIMILISTPAVVNAMKRLLGYIPGIGMVEQNVPIRVLEHPLPVTRDGVTITVVNAVADASSTIVVFKVENLFARQGQTLKLHDATCQQFPVLLLPDGSRLAGDGSGKGWTTGYSRRMIFPRLPADVQDVRLLIPCLQQVVPATVPANWEIPMHFVPAPPTMTVYPVLDLPAPTSAPQATPTAAGVEVPLSRDSISLTLDTMVPAGEGLLLNGKLQSMNPDLQMELVQTADVHLLDANGNEITIGENSQPGPASGTNGLLYPFSYIVSGVYPSGPATFRIDNLAVGMNSNISFSFNLGENPQPGQTWKLNQELTVGDKKLILSTVSLGTNGKSLVFTFDSRSEIQSAMLMDATHPIMPGGGGEGSAGFTYEQEIPKGPITVAVPYASFNLAGPWQVNVDLPAPTAPTATQPAANSTPDRSASPSKTEVCLTPSKWYSAMARKDPLPAGLAGTLALSVLDEKDLEYKIVVTQLDGSNRVEIGAGDWPSLSPDGSTVVYTAEDGLHIHNMGTQEDKVVPGTAKYDRNALWAPDGKRFAFTRGPVSGLIGAPGPYNIMLADRDGSNVRPLTNRPGANLAMAWTLDGSKIIYSQDSTDGSSDMALDVQTGFSSPIFTTSHSFSSLSLSPDGTREVFEEMQPGDVYGITVSNLDGSNKHLIVTGGSVNVTMPIWSPDGKWVIASAHDLQIPNSFSKLVLINPDTCEVVALPAMSGYVYTWLK